MPDKQDNIAIDVNSLLVPVSIIIVGIVVAGAVFFGLKNSRSSGSKESKGGQAEISEKAGDSSPAGRQVQPQNAQVKTSIDDDAILGNKETAEIAIVEFSDFECSFCKRFRDETLDQLKENYIDNGSVILVYRDLPLPFHEPAATREAMAAECAGEQGGDEIYYQFHDKIYEQSPGNGQGISEEKLAEIGVGLGLDKGELKNCIADKEFSEEVKKDAQDAGRVGISGTPGFVVGKLSEDGSVEGVVISGAQPYSVFENAIEQLLK